MSTREINQVIRKFTPEMQEIKGWLDQALDQVKAWEANPDGLPTPTELSDHKDQLLMAYARYRIVQSEIDVLVSYLRRIMDARQSAHEAYQSGWEACLTHLFAQLDEEEYRQLRHAIYAVAKEDEMPF